MVHQCQRRGADWQINTPLAENTHSKCSGWKVGFAEKGLIWGLCNPFYGHESMSWFEFPTRPNQEFRIH